MRAARHVRLLALLAGGAFLPSVQAQQAGDLMVQLGWFYIAPQESSEPLRTQLAPSVLGSLLGIDPDFSSPGTAASVSDSSTPALTLSYFVNDHLAIKAEGGMPAEFDLSGQGQVRPTGLTGLLLELDLGAAQSNPLASARQWSPAILLQWYFFDYELRLRPYLGVGATYTWFTNVDLNPAFRDDIMQNFGAPLALAAGTPGPTRVEAQASPSWAPIANIGLSYALGGRWSASLSVSYLWLDTTSTIDLYAEDGTRLARSTTHLDLNPIISSLLLSYSF